MYTGLVFGRTVFPMTAFFEAPKESTALEVITIFLNAGTFLIVAIVAGGLAERFRSTREELETKQADLKDLEAFTDLVFQSVGTGLIAVIAACEDLSAIRAMEARMRAADRLASLGRMAANIAHEIRNPLASLSGAVEVLAAGALAGETRERLAQIVLKDAERLNGII